MALCREDLAWKPPTGAFCPDSLPLSGRISERWLSSPKQPDRIWSAERSGSVLVLCSGRLIEKSEIEPALIAFADSDQATIRWSRHLHK
jgi:hypothetical protein